MAALFLMSTEETVNLTPCTEEPKSGLGVSGAEHRNIILLVGKMHHI